MRARELEGKAWQLILGAKSCVNKHRRKVLMQEAFDLLRRASALRQVEDGGEPPTCMGLQEIPYKMRLNNGGSALWVFLDAESRADAAWEAYTLARAVSDYFEDFDLWEGTDHLISASTSDVQFVGLTSDGICLKSQQSLLDREEAIINSKARVARSKKLLQATTRLRSQIANLEDEAESSRH